ncbi:MAG: YraN family protein [Salibacteraceae bacterium]
MADHNDLGRLGEFKAVEFLTQNGFKILATNWRFRRDEVDVICQNTDYLVFVEVKTRSSREFGDPSDAVTNSKIKHLIEAAEEYIVSNNIEKETRFDVIEVVADGNQYTINHIPDAFSPSF